MKTDTLLIVGGAALLLYLLTQKKGVSASGVAAGTGPGGAGYCGVAPAAGGQASTGGVNACTVCCLF